MNSRPTARISTGDDRPRLALSRLSYFALKLRYTLVYWSYKRLESRYLRLASRQAFLLRCLRDAK